MISATAMAADLRGHFSVCREVLAVVERESQFLRDPQTPSPSEVAQAKKILLPRLTDSLAKLRQHRAHWQRLSPGERAQHPEIVALLRQSQDLIMKIIMLDRENEQLLLRRGLVPAGQFPSPQRQRPHFVAELYRRQGTR